MASDEPAPPLARRASAGNLPARSEPPDRAAPPSRHCARTPLVPTPAPWPPPPRPRRNQEPAPRLSSRDSRADGLHRSREMRRAAVREVIPRHRRDHHVLQRQAVHRLRHTARFLGIYCVRPACGHGAVPAIPRAYMAQNHQRRRAPLPARTHIRTARALTHTVCRLRSLKSAFHARKRLATRPLPANPRWKLPFHKEFNPSFMFLNRPCNRHPRIIACDSQSIISLPQPSSPDNSTAPRTNGALRRPHLLRRAHQTGGETDFANGFTSNDLTRGAIGNPATRAQPPPVRAPCLPPTQDWFGVQASACLGCLSLHTPTPPQGPCGFRFLGELGRLPETHRAFRALHAEASERGDPSSVWASRQLPGTHESSRLLICVHPYYYPSVSCSLCIEVEDRANMARTVRTGPPVP